MLSAISVAIIAICIFVILYIAFILILLHGFFANYGVVTTNYLDLLSMHASVLTFPVSMMLLFSNAKHAFISGMFWGSMYSLCAVFCAAIMSLIRCNTKAHVVLSGNSGKRVNPESILAIVTGMGIPLMTTLVDAGSKLHRDFGGIPKAISTMAFISTAWQVAALGDVRESSDMTDIVTTATELMACVSLTCVIISLPLCD